MQSPQVKRYGNEENQKDGIATRKPYLPESDDELTLGVDRADGGAARGHKLPSRALRVLL